MPKNQDCAAWLSHCTVYRLLYLNRSVSNSVSLSLSLPLCCCSHSASQLFIYSRSSCKLISKLPPRGQNSIAVWLIVWSTMKPALAPAPGPSPALEHLYSHSHPHPRPNSNRARTRAQVALISKTLKRCSFICQKANEEEGELANESVDFSETTLANRSQS